MEGKEDITRKRNCRFGNYWTKIINWTFPKYLKLLGNWTKKIVQLIISPCIVLYRKKIDTSQITII